MTPVCDYLTVSTELGNGPALFGALADITLRLPDAVTSYNAVTVGPHGRMHYSERKDSKVATVSASGVLLAKLRAMDLLFEYCATVAATPPYKVTHLDLACDVEADCPTEIEALYSRLRVTGCALTRKRTLPSQITQMLSPGIDGRDTGTVFVGNRKRAETTAVVYDRRHDAIVKGKPDPGPLLRYEIRTGVPGLSLKDAFAPAPLFYHFASPDLLPRPANVPDWQAWGEGFAVPRQQEDVAMKLSRLVDRSSDLERMLDLAEQLGPCGLDQLRRLLNQRIKLRQQTTTFNQGASQARSAEPEGRPH